MIFELLRLNIDVADQEFDVIYPAEIKDLSRKHWTPVAIAKLAAEFLAERPGTRVLDIGSGAGKFCLVGAAHTKGYFTGIEQRHDLAELSRRLAVTHRLHNTKFIHGNIRTVRFRDYDAFYFYNSFHENIDLHNKIDDRVTLDAKLYHLYSIHVVKQFASLPVGARVVTYCSPLNILPRSFRLIDSLHGGSLNFWEKAHSGARFQVPVGRPGLSL